MTAFVPELAITAANTVPLNWPLILTVSGAPYDLTGASFLCQARTTADPDADKLCDITVQIVGLPTAGTINLHAPASAMLGLAPQEGVYDLVITPPGGADPFDAWQAPFNVVQGISR